MVRRSVVVVVTLVVALVGCGDEGDKATCTEDARAQTIDERTAVTVGGTTVMAEVADTSFERDAGWQHRLCGLDGILLVPQERRPLPIWMCNVVSPLDLVFIRDGAVVQVENAAPPCLAPCTECTIYGSDTDVDAVLELPASRASVEVGDSVNGVNALE